MTPSRRRVGKALAAALAKALLLSVAPQVWSSEPAPVLIGITAEFGHPTSTSAQSIRAGILAAIEEINARGGVLGKRPLELVERDDRSVPSRGVDNFRELAAMKGMAGVFVGKFSTVAMELVPLATTLRVPLLVPWAAADGLVDNREPLNYVFRLSLRDAWAMEALVRGAHERGFRKLGLIVPNSAWGRSSIQAASSAMRIAPKAVLLDPLFYNFGDRTLQAQYNQLVSAGADALLLVANEPEGAILVNEVVSSGARKLPIFSHWGITGGRFTEIAKANYGKLDLSVVQTFSFADSPSEKARRVGTRLMREFSVESVRQLPSQVGAAHAYDLTHILAAAITKAGTADGAAVRQALLASEAYDGLIKRYAKPFAPGRQEALSAQNVYLAKYDEEGVLVRANVARRR